MASEVLETEKKNILNRLLDAVKQCQVRFGGKKELATDSDNRIVSLCSCWEAALQHGMKNTSTGKALSTLKQVTEKSGLVNIPGVSDIKNIETEPAFFHYVKEILNKHENQRFRLLKNITTDAGRGRAWLRASLNENSLERYMHTIIGNEALLLQFYEDWAFLRDQEKSSMLPIMAAGLGSILFAIAIDSEHLNAIIRPAIGLDGLFQLPKLGEIDDEEAQKPVMTAIEPLSLEKKKERKKKKKAAKLVSFDEKGTGCGSSSPTVTSVLKRDTDKLIKKSATPTKYSSLKFDNDQTSDLESGEIGKIHQNVLTNQSMTMELKNNFTSVDSEYLGTCSNSTTSRSVDKTDDENDECSIYDGKDNSHMVNSSQLSDPADNTPKSSIASTSPTSPQSVSSRDFSFSPPTTLHLSDVRCRSLSEVRNASDSDIYCNIPPLTDTPVTLTPMTPIGGDNESLMMYPTANSNGNTSDTASIDSYNIPTCPYTESAAYALQLAQIGLDECIPDYLSCRTAGDGSNDPESPAKETMSTQELKQAVVAMMVRKDEVEDENRRLRAMCETEQESSTSLRAEIDEIRKAHHATVEKDQGRIQALTRENELLKHQLKKYVNAVQMLRREGLAAEGKIGVHLDDVQPAIPSITSTVDYSHEASEYEKKLIQVAEMHGELIEFNELLHKQLVAKESQIHRLRRDLIELRGPLPNNDDQNEDAASVSSDADILSPTSRPLINVWIPCAFMRGVGPETHHVYQVYVRIKDVEWTVYRRYAQFYESRNKLRKKYPILGTFDFPPKKAIGNKGTKFVEERRKKLQNYIRQVINWLVQNNAHLASNACKESLVSLVPVLGDMPDKKTTKSRRKSAPIMTPPITTAVAEMYMGL